jgi:hypothetical protein
VTDARAQPPAAVVDSLVAAVGRGDAGAVVGPLGRAHRNGADVGLVARATVAGLLAAHRFELQGTRRTHAVLTTLAAAELADRGLGEMGWAAVVNGLSFLADSPPTRQRGVATEAQPWPGSAAFSQLVARDGLAEADGALLGLGAGSQELSRASWLSIGAASLEGWGHRLIGARLLWDAGLAFPAGRASYLRAGLRLWCPWVAEPLQVVALQLAREGGLGGTAPGGDHPVHEGAVRGLGEGLLTSNGLRVLGQALASGVSPTSVACGVALAACRVLLAAPGLQGVHGITAAHAALAVARCEGADAAPALLGAAALVNEAWQARVRDGRLPLDWGRGALDVPPPVSAMTVDEAVGKACRAEALPVFGHGVKLSLACLELVEALPDPLAIWPRAALIHSAGSWPSIQRPWLRLRRHLASAGVP